MRALAGAEFANARVVALNDDGSERETQLIAVDADGRIPIPGGKGLRLYGVVAIP
jgi:hypothetical protein